MKRYPTSSPAEKNQPPAGYATSAAVCRGFLQQHAPSGQVVTLFRQGFQALRLRESVDGEPTRRRPA